MNKRGLARRLIWLAGTLLLGLAIAYITLTGPKDLSRYPAPDNSPYKLPYPAGVTWQCVQSNRGIVSHREDEEFAFDFYMPVGSDVCAARGGKVVRVVDHHDGNGRHAPNNRVVITHEDGTRGSYLHIKKGGSLVRVSDTVKQGQKIALSGHVGRSLAPHLHFEVRLPDSGATIPISFADVPDDSGVPRMFKRYTSGNAAPQW